MFLFQATPAPLPTAQSTDIGQPPVVGAEGSAPQTPPTKILSLEDGLPATPPTKVTPFVAGASLLHTTPGTPVPNGLPRVPETPPSKSTPSSVQSSPEGSPGSGRVRLRYVPTCRPLNVSNATCPRFPLRKLPPAQRVLQAALQDPGLKETYLNVKDAKLVRPLLGPTHC